MILLGGIHRLDGYPVNQQSADLLFARLQTGPLDGSGQYRAPEITMGYRELHRNGRPGRETQLLRLGSCVVSCDARLDNVGDLKAALRRELGHTSGDAALILASYQKWGQDFLTRLIGDFALALWDGTTETLLLARDAAGPRPLFYHVNTNRVIWSSDLSTLMDIVGEPLQVDDEYVAGYLTLQPEPGLTPYKGIRAVEPGRVVTFGNGRESTRTFWRLDPNLEIRYGKDSDYEEHFRHLFREAVECRLRVDGPVWATLSGGLDSSAIVCMADEILKYGEAEASRLETVSYVYDASPSSDESRFIERVEEWRGRKGHHLFETDFPVLRSFPDDSDLSFPDFLDCFVDRHRALAEAMCRDGARVLFTGHGGDELLSGAGDPTPGLGDLLVQGRLFRFLRELRTWSLVSRRSSLQTFFCGALAQIMPVTLRALSLDASRKPAPWIDETFAASMGLKERMLPYAGDLPFSLPSGRDQAEGFYSAVRLVSRAAYRLRGRIDVVHPYMHRPLVEFLQAIPFDQRVRVHQSRSLMRRSLGNLLPREVAARIGKQGPDEVVLRGVAREWSRLRPLFDNPQVCARGYMNARALQAALERARHGCEPHSFALITTISLEFWLRALDRRGSMTKTAAVV